MATTRQRNGRWYFRITLSTNGRTRYIERGSYDSEEEALLAGMDYESKIKTDHRVIPQARISYGDMAEQWITEYAPVIYKPNTITTHKKVLKNYILPVIKDYDVAAVTTKILQDLINEEIPNHTQFGLSKIRVTLAKSFDYGIACGYITQNPVFGLVMPRKRSIKAREAKPIREIKPCSKGLVNAIFDRFPEGHPCYIPLLLGYRCGLRLGEAYGLYIEDFDRVNRKLYIRRQIQYNDDNELYFTDPKYCDPGEFRVIDLDSNTWRILMRHVQKIEKSRPVMNHKQYYITPDGKLSESAGEPIYLLNVRAMDGSYISPRTMQHVSRVIHGKTGKFNYVDPLWDFHGLRHTHTSDCIAAGMPPESVQKRLGHKNLTTTYRYYVHETESQHEEAKQILEAMYS